ncbi:hypothetical protein PoB_001294100 [Plakobranchus ocellatus]|uniref:Uncharacterized protein n=1 Tax=Plakobranchus ocellatus TaxID=259542 RepID=A0AAV3YGJ9_9GAST|nr:hypothetical protein PoB_001294100 [Plakobranchus ocellatus]
MKLNPERWVPLKVELCHCVREINDWTYFPRVFENLVTLFILKYPDRRRTNNNYLKDQDGDQHFPVTIPDRLSVMKNYLKGRRCPEAMEVFDGCLVQDRVRSVGEGAIHQSGHISPSPRDRGGRKKNERTHRAKKLTGE